MDVNEMVFDSVKKYMSGEKDNLLIKICMGNATEEEKKTWQGETELPDEVVNKLKECCDIGYNMASQLDKDTIKTGNDLLTEKFESLSKQVESLVKRVEELEKFQELQK
jgi:hypothetical protein